MSYRCSNIIFDSIGYEFLADTSISSIGNDFVEASCNNGKVTLVEIYYGISKKYIPVGYSMNFIDLANRTAVYYM